MSAPESLVPDRPLGFMDMLSATVRYLRGNPAATLGIGALLGTFTSAVYGVVIDGMVFGNGRASELAQFGGSETLTQAQLETAMQQVADAAPWFALAGLVGLVVQFASMGVMTLGMVHAMRGEQVRPGEIWRQVPWRRIIGVNLLVFAMLLIGISVPVAAAVLLGGAWAISALAFAATLAFVLAALSSLAVPAAIIDDLAPRAAIRHVFRICRGATARTVWLVFASLLVWDMVGSIVAGPIAALFAGLAGGADSPAGSALSGIVTGIVSGAIALPATSAMAVLIYVDRIRRMRPMPE